MKNTSRYFLVNDVLTHIAFIIWASLALWFYQERLYSDSGFYVSKLVHYETFWVELSRFVQLFFQWLPLLCIKLGFSLKVVLLAHSFAHVLFFYLIYWIGRYKWGNHQIGWFLIGTQTVGILHSFSVPGFELYYVIAFLALFSIILNTNDFSLRNRIYLISLIAIIVINYVLSLWLIGGILALHFSTYKFKYWKTYGLIVSTMLLSFIFKQVFTTHSYEIAKMEQFVINLTERAYTWEGYIKPLLNFYGQYYMELWLIVLLTIMLYIKNSKYVVAVGYLLFLIVTQYLIALTYPGIRHSRYQEQCYVPLIFVACFPLIMNLKVNLKLSWKWGLTIGLFALVVYRYIAIAISLEPFTHRVNYMHRIIAAAQKIEGNKFIVHEHNWNPSFCDPSFTLGVESMLLSGMNPKQKTIQVIRDSEWLWQDSANIRTLQDTNLYLFTYRSFYDRTDSIYQHKDANVKYYNFPDGKYRFLNGNAPKVDSIKELQNALVLEASPDRSYRRGELVNIPIKITNVSAKSINTEQIRIAYHWWKEDKIVHWEGLRSAIELDLLPDSGYNQYFLVRMPTEAGQYELQVDIVTNDVLGWMNYHQHVPVQVY